MEAVSMIIDVIRGITHACDAALDKEEFIYVLLRKIGAIEQQLARLTESNITQNGCASLQELYKKIVAIRADITEILAYSNFRRFVLAFYHKYRVDCHVADLDALCAHLELDVKIDTSIHMRRISSALRHMEDICAADTPPEPPDPDPDHVAAALAAMQIRVTDLARANDAARARLDAFVAETQDTLRIQYDTFAEINARLRRLESDPKRVFLSESPTTTHNVSVHVQTELSFLSDTHTHTAKAERTLALELQRLAAAERVCQYLRARVKIEHA